ncbi:MAG: RHS repeat-associated core domain-containing protein, partial [Anaerolineae bacterium]
VLDEVAGGLYFYNARYYDPALGRFTQADTLIPQPQNPQSLNRYAYAANNSLRFSDPSGHAAVCGTSVDGGCGTTPPRSSRPVIVPLPAPTPPLGTPTPGQVTANQGGTANSWSWDALFSPDTMVTLYKGEGDIRDYAFGFVNTREGYSIYKVVGRNGQEYWVAAGSAAALRRIGLNPGVANSSRAMNAIRAAGRGGDGPFLLAGGLASVGPNLIAHAGHGDFFSKNTVTDLIVDTGGWAFSEGVGLVVGLIAGGATANALVAMGGEVVGSIGGSLYWDNDFAPKARVTVRMWLK